MNTCDQDTAKFMSKALLDHAKEINRFAKTYREPFLPSAETDERHQRKFAHTIERMIHGMDALLLMAQYKGISRYCNQELIEAYIEEARSALEPAYAAVRQSAPQFN